jgi:hypothetical protein
MTTPLPRRWNPQRVQAVRIGLTPADMEMANAIGDARQARAERLGASHRHSPPKLRDTNNRIGVQGELAVARVFDLPEPRADGQPPAGDVGDIEVRSARSTGANGKPRVSRLILHEHDHADRRYLFVIVTGRWFDLCGWRMGGDWRDHPAWLRPGQRAGWAPAYYVPNAELYPMGTWNVRP